MKKTTQKNDGYYGYQDSRGFHVFDKDGDWVNTFQDVATAKYVFPNLEVV